MVSIHPSVPPLLKQQVTVFPNNKLSRRELQGQCASSCDPQTWLYFFLLIVLTEAGEQGICSFPGTLSILERDS